MKPVKVRHPEIEVILRKNVGRTTFDGATPVSERFSGQRRTIDLTPYLGDQGSVRVTKSVREPAGAFSIAFADRIHQDAADSVYGLVEPMDVVEIRMAGDSHEYTESVGAPVVMRGLVSQVQRTEGMGGDGKPMRTVTISGQDYGKIWQILQVFNLPHLPDTGASLITSFPFFQRYGLTFNTMPASQFVREVVDKVINPFIEQMRVQGATGGRTDAQIEGALSRARSTSPLFTLRTDIQIAGGLDGTVSAFALGDWKGGTIYSLLAQHCDIGPWNELFIEDREDGPYVVYRPNPFMTADGRRYVMPLVTPPAIVPITRADVVSLSVTRGDANVANYFWVDAPHFNLNHTEALRAFAFQGQPDTFFVQNHGNVNPQLYGIRKMWEQTGQGGVNQTSDGNSLPDGNERTINQQSFVAWMESRRLQLIEQNKDNVVFESGGMRLKGNEQIRAGTYVRLRNGGVESDYYAVSVQHDYAPFTGFFTTVNFERGTGFIDRVQLGSGATSPYWSERSED